MATKRQIADDFLKFNKKGALVSIPAICEYFGFGKNKTTQIVAQLTPFGEGTGKRYFYIDVVEKIMEG